MPEAFKPGDRVRRIKYEKDKKEPMCNGEVITIKEVWDRGKWLTFKEDPEGNHWWADFFEHEFNEQNTPLFGHPKGN